MERAGAEEPDFAARCLRELSGEAGPEGVRAQPEGEQILLSPARLADRSEHAGGDAGGAGTREITLEHPDGEAPPREPPGAGEPDHAGADDHRI